MNEIETGTTPEDNLNKMKVFNNYDLWINKWDKGKAWDSKPNISKEFLEKHISDKFTIVDNILEIAIGFGRMTQEIIPYCKNIYGIDMNQLCVDYCNSNFNGIFAINNGYDIPFEDNLFDCVISFDSMVHFHPDIIDIYLKEIYRTSKKGAYSILHHAASGETKIGFRSQMTDTLMKKMAIKYNFKIIDQTYSWYLSENKFNDCTTILQK